MLLNGGLSRGSGSRSIGRHGAVKFSISKSADMSEDAIFVRVTLAAELIMTECAVVWSACGWGIIRRLHHVFRDFCYMIEELVGRGHLLRFVIVAVRICAYCDFVAVDPSLQFQPSIFAYPTHGEQVSVMRVAQPPEIAKPPTSEALKENRHVNLGGQIGLNDSFRVRRGSANGEREVVPWIP